MDNSATGIFLGELYGHAVHSPALSGQRLRAQHANQAAIAQAKATYNHFLVARQQQGVNLAARGILWGISGSPFESGINKEKQPARKPNPIKYKNRVSSYTSLKENPVNYEYLVN